MHLVFGPQTSSRKSSSTKIRSFILDFEIKVNFSIRNPTWNGLCFLKNLLENEVVNIFSHRDSIPLFLPLDGDNYDFSNRTVLNWNEFLRTTIGTLEEVVNRHSLPLTILFPLFRRVFLTRWIIIFFSSLAIARAAHANLKPWFTCVEKKNYYCVTVDLCTLFYLTKFFLFI